MKATSFEQLKTMLKSASYAIFKRVSALEKSVTPPDKSPNRIYETDKNGVAGWREKEFIPPVIYIDFSEVTNISTPAPKAWKDAELTTQLTYNQGVNILRQGGMVSNGDEDELYTILSIIQNDRGKTITVAIQLNTWDSEGNFGRSKPCDLQFSDSTNN